MNGGSRTARFTPGERPVGEWAADSVRGVASSLLPLLALLLVWVVVAQLTLVPRQALPLPTDVARTAAGLLENGTLVSAAATTTFRALTAFLLAVGLGVSLGLAMSRWRAVEWFFDPLISVGFPVPKVTLVPVYVLWFGFGTLPAVLLGVTSATFPVAIATYQGASGVDRELVWSARSMGVSRARTTLHVVFPAALPDVFNGVQISLFLSFVVVVVAEMVTSGGGLGALLTRSVRFFQTPAAIAAILVVAALGLVFDRLLRAVRARTLRWTE